MKIFLITFGMFLVFILAMAIGYIIKKNQIKGSCGGLSAIGIERECNCSEPCQEAMLYQIQEPKNKKNCKNINTKNKK